MITLFQKTKCNIVFFFAGLFLVHIGCGRHMDAWRNLVEIRLNEGVYEFAAFG